MHRTTAELEAGLDHVRAAPKDEGTVELIVCRPTYGERTVLETGELTAAVGLKGDNWIERGSSKTADGSSHPEMQLNIMNARAASLIAVTDERRQLAGDQLFIDFDISTANLPPGTRLALGTAVIEVSAEPHTGCQKFTQRFGLDAMRFVNSTEGRALNLRGINAFVVEDGSVRTGDPIRKLQ